ncbi:MAG: hypothetical protein GXY61_05950 [Lentisphaerae bacterium]|nr:hypothetical protein [Lentisphaerota bacterium]
MRGLFLMLFSLLVVVACSEKKEQPAEGQESRAARYDAMLAAFEMPKLVALELKYGVDQQVVRNVMALNSYQSQMNFYKRAVAATNGFPQKLHDELLNQMQSVAASNNISENVVGAIYYDLQVYEQTGTR